MEKCTICDVELISEEPKILTMGAYGTPKYLCLCCSDDIDEATRGKDIDSIAAAMDRLGKRMAETNPDKLTFDTVNTIMESAAERAKRIKEGTYDFSLDDEESDDDDGFDEIPEELLETEEDRELDRADEEVLRKFDKFYNILVGVLSAAFVGFVVWRIVDTFFLK